MQISHVVPLLNLLTIAKAGDWILVARATIRAAIMGRSTLTQFVNRPAFGNQHTGLEWEQWSHMWKWCYNCCSDFIKPLSMICNTSGKAVSFNLMQLWWVCSHGGYCFCMFWRIMLHWKKPQNFTKVQEVKGCSHWKSTRFIVRKPVQMESNVIHSALMLTKYYWNPQLQ